MTTNLLSRVPIPGSFGVSTGTAVDLHISTTDTILQSTVTITINGTQAILAGAFRPGFGGTIVTDGSGGWTVHIVPTTTFSFGATQTIAVACTESTGPTPFSQSYSFQTLRDLQITASVTYYEEGDVVEADITVHEGQTARPLLVDSLMLTLLRDGVVTDQIWVDNSGRDMAAAGTFSLRILHPQQILQTMTFQARATLDSHQAPGIPSLTAAATLQWVARKYTPQVPGQTPGLQASTQPDLRLGAVVQGTNPSVQGVESMIAVAQQQYETVDLSKTGDALVEPTILVDLDFLNSSQYLQTLEGDPQYAGGGNRILTGIDSADEWFLQEADELPVTFGARMPLEGASTNLLPGSLLATNLFTQVLPDDTIRCDAELSALCSGVQQVLYAVEGTVTYDGIDRNIRLETPIVTIATGQPVLCSVLARTQLRDTSVTLDTFTMRVRFYNSSSTELGHTDFNFDIFGFESDTTFSVMEGLVQAGDVPATATKASFDLVIGSWEGCDLMNLWLAAPMIQNAAFTTSRVVGTSSVTRASDLLTLPQPGNINQRNGRITTTFTPPYSGSPPVNVCVWDTRDAGTLRSGFMLRHRTDGKLELTCTDDTGTVTTALSGSAVVLTAGTPVELIGQWGATLLTVQRDHLVVAQQSGSFSHPGTIPATMAVGRQQDGSEPLLGELHTFLVYGI